MTTSSVYTPIMKSNSQHTSLVFRVPGSFLLSLVPPGCADCSRNMCTLLCCGAGDTTWVVAPVLNTQIWWKLITVYLPRLPLEVSNLQEVPGFQNSYIRQNLLLWQLSRWKDRFLIASHSAIVLYSSFFGLLLLHISST
jgi:hypothetical protein